MTSSLTVKTTRPGRDFTSITQTGLKALSLALTHKDALDARLPGTLDGLSQDLDTLGVVIPGAVQAHHEARAATSAQNAVARQGYAQVRAIRETVRKSGAPKDIQRAYGVGQRAAPSRIRDVKAALQQIVDRATVAPAEAAGFGLIPADVAALTTFVSSLSDADRTQEKKRASAPLSTRERNVTANRILQAVALIAGAGRIAFADSPLTHASFEALTASAKKAAPSKAKRNAERKAKQSAESAVESAAAEASAV